jgi:hypothetical protein
LLNNNQKDSSKETHKFLKLKLMNHEDNGISNGNYTTYSTSAEYSCSSPRTYFNSSNIILYNKSFIGKYPDEIISKMKKKFPDIVKTESHFSSKGGMFRENERINKMKSKIDKLFQS